MPLFEIYTDVEGRVRQIEKDGQPYNAAVNLEQAFSVVTIYFKAARNNLGQLSATSDRSLCRPLGLQSFVLSLTGSEAFANTFFHLRGTEQNLEAVVLRSGQTHGSLTNKFRDLLELSGLPPLIDGDRLRDQIFALSQLRNDTVHPRWEPSELIIH